MSARCPITVYCSSGQHLLLRLWMEQCCRDAVYRELSQLNKGDLIMLRGDFMYARVAYRANRACAHAYIDTSLFLRPTYQPPDIVALIDDTRLRMTFSASCGIAL
ncbi:hypothetical protein GQ600_26742 [Phytophthora cactorum]|nr:hypothetical protein GQ600_26742 [Phytophthora cactorum]